VKKRGYICLAGVVLASIMALMPSASAQYESDLGNRNPFEYKEEVRRKDPGFFHRPAKDTPAGQMEFARKLLVEGRQKAAMKQFNAIVHQWHTSPEAPVAQLEYARILYDRKKYKAAFDEFQYLIDNFTGQFPYDEALDKQFRIANYYMTAKRMDFLFFPGFKIQEQALPLFEKIVKNAPAWTNAVDSQYNIGLIHEYMKDYDKAVSEFDALRFRYPHSPRAADAAFRRAYCLYLLAEDNPRDEAICRRALSALAGFLADHPRHESIGMAQQYRDKLDDRLANMYYELAVFYDKTPGKQKAALIAYEDFARRFPSSKVAGEVAARIETLKVELENKK